MVWLCVMCNGVIKKEYQEDSYNRNHTKLLEGVAQEILYPKFSRKNEFSGCDVVGCELLPCSCFSVVLGWGGLCIYWLSGRQLWDFLPPEASWRPSKVRAATGMRRTWTCRFLT